MKDVNVHDMNDVIWAITTRADAARDTMIINNAPTDTLDPASPLVNLGSNSELMQPKKPKKKDMKEKFKNKLKLIKQQKTWLIQSGPNMDFNAF